MTQLPSRMAPPGDDPDALVLEHRQSPAGQQDIVMVPAPDPRVRPDAGTLVERLRIMQMQGWSREEPSE
jgi:hypothetical protein